MSCWSVFNTCCCDHRHARAVECDAEPERRAVRMYFRMLAAEHLHHMEQLAGEC